MPHETMTFTRRPAWSTALWRGLKRRCPHCGQGAAFAGYLKPVQACAACQAPLGEIRADDAPPYFTIVAVGHVVIPAMLLTEQMAAPPTWVHMAVWPLLTTILTLATLPFIKGGVLGLMWAVGLKGGEHH